MKPLAVAAMVLLTIAGPAFAQEQDEFTVMPPLGFNFPAGKPLDILGIYPGMPLETAKPIIARLAYEAGQKTNDIPRQREWPQSTTDPISGKRYDFFYSGGFNGSTQALPRDHLAVIASSPTADAQVLAVGRVMWFDVGEQPPARATYDSLVSKYGPVAFNSTTDARQRRVSPPKGLDADSVPQAANACSAFVWYFSADKSRQDPSFNYDPDIGTWTKLLSSYTGAKILRENLMEYYQKARGRGALGIRLYAAMCNGDVAGRLSALTLTMNDIYRANSASAIEKERREAAQREQEFQKQQAPAGQVPKL